MIKEIAFKQLLDSSIVVDYDDARDSYTMVVQNQWGGEWWWWWWGWGTPTKSLLSAIQAWSSADWMDITIIQWDVKYTWYSSFSWSFPDVFFDKPVWLPQTITSVIVNPGIYPPASWSINGIISVYKNGTLVKSEFYGSIEMYLTAPFAINLETWLESWQTNVWAWTDTFKLEIINDFSSNAALNVQSIYINGYLS